MAFSYSDKNFTVVGNLCFVHIKTTTTGAKTISIPSALSERMLIDNFWVSAYSVNEDGSTPSVTSVNITGGAIKFSPRASVAYVNFLFPIDSNK